MRAGTTHCVATREVARATGASRWAWEWRGWAPWRLDSTILFLAALTVLVDVASAWADVSIGRLGRVPISPALPIAVVLAARIGLGALGFSRAGVRAWREYAVGVGLVLGIAIVGYVSDVAGIGEAIGLVGAAAGEELVYRLAVLVVVGALAARVYSSRMARPDAVGDRARVSSPCSSARSRSVHSRATSSRCAASPRSRRSRASRSFSVGSSSEPAPCGRRSQSTRS